MKDYRLTKIEEEIGSTDSKKIKSDSPWTSLKVFTPFLKGENVLLILVTVLILVNSAANVVAPFILGLGVDEFVKTKDFNQVIYYSLILGALYIVILFTGYAQTQMMGGLGQRVLFKLRAQIFEKIQSLPVAFFQQNKTGDLISRINSDTEKLNQLFSEVLVRLAGNIFTLIGIGIFILFINLQLGLVTLSAGVILLVYTAFISPWIERRNKKSLTTLGALSAEIQESLNNFKVILAFNRRDYLRDRFHEVNNKNFKDAVDAGIANNISTPIYDLAANVAQILVLLFGIYLITQGNLTLGILVSFITYADRFYSPLRQLASLFSSVQVSIAAGSRVNELLSLDTDLIILTETEASTKADNAKDIIEFHNVSFGYDENRQVLENINFNLEKGKTYAFVGPTGGGKTTTASLIMRLFDPINGHIHFEGKDLRTFDPKELSSKIGFILQEPFLFTGTLAQNIIYGNEKYANYNTHKILRLLESKGLTEILERFPDGLDSQIDNNSENLSLGQKQLIAFLRAILREPQLLILDEATANIDTITEEQLEKILERLPSETTLIIIAHRLNTIQDADEILFVNGGHVEKAGTFDQAIKLIEGSRRKS